jgi:hypothetical protein
VDGAVVVDGIPLEGGELPVIALWVVLIREADGAGHAENSFLGVVAPVTPDDLRADGANIPLDFRSLARGEPAKIRKKETGGLTRRLCPCGPVL